MGTMIATSNLFRLRVIISISFPRSGVTRARSVPHLGGERSRKIANGRDCERSTGLVNGKRRGAVSRYLTGWSLGGGSVEPSRRITGPTGVEVLVGGGGGGLGVGLGCGGMGWVMVAANGGGAGVAGWGLMRSARLGA